MKTARLIARAVALGAAWAVLAGASQRVDAPLAEAAMRGDVVRVRALLASRADVNAATGDGMTALHWAADRGDLAMTELLLRARAKLTATTRIGSYTPLHVAARKGNAGVIRALLKAGADANVLAINGVSALHLAAIAGDPDAVSALLDAKADVNAREREWGQTPLVFAASNNRADAIKVLLAKGADAKLATRLIDLPEEEKRERAAAAKRNEVLLLSLPEKVRDSLKAAAARAPAPGPGGRPGAAPATEPPPAGPPPAQPAAAAAQGPGGMPLALLRQAPPTNTLTAAQIQQAIAAGREAYMAGPTAGGADIPQAPVDTSNGGDASGFSGSVGKMGGLTALHHAVRQGNIAAALALIEGGADINQVSTSDGTSPLLLATLNGQFDLAMELVKRGADVKVASIHGTTPLYATINTMYLPRSRYPQPQSVQVQKTSHIDLMEAILKAGADVNARLTKNLWFFGYSNCGNANCGLEFLDGTTAFWRAAYAVDVDAMRLLKKYGADHTIPSFRQAAARGGRGGGAPGAPAGPPDSSNAGRLAAARAQLQQGGFGGAQRLSPEMDSASKAVPPGIGVYPVHSAAGVGYGNGFAGNAHRHAPDGWMPAMKYLVEELGVDVNQRDNNGYTALHHAASRGDNEMILYLVSKGADPKAVSRNGRTTVDMANGPVQRLRPFPETIALLEKMGAKNNHNCVGC